MKKVLTLTAIAFLLTTGAFATQTGTVRGEDLERAQSVLAEFRKGGDDVDWSQVDVGDPEE